MWTILAVLTLATGALARKQFIVGGSDADIADYPWQGSYRTGSGSHTCGCVFVGGNLVLTAAHCGGDSSYSMEFGNSDRGTGPYTNITTVVAHPDYGNGAGFSPNDIAIVTAAEEISGPNIAAIPMSSNDDTRPETQPCQISGWGRLSGGGVLPVTLQAVNISLYPNANCSIVFGADFQADIHVCVHDSVNQDKGSCNGDSGGPLNCAGELVGLTSWGYVGCPTSAPSVYARVSAFFVWVCTETGNAAAGCPPPP